MKLAKMREELIETKLVERRCFGFFRMIRGSLDAWVSRAAPTIAAEAEADEGRVWRALAKAMRALQRELSEMDLAQALAMDGTDEDEAEADRALDAATD